MPIIRKLTTGRDFISDFATGDVIDLHSIDANGGLAGDQAFTFTGEDAFHGTVGELRFAKLGSSTFVEADVNGDGAADMQIERRWLIGLQAVDFIL